jgi:hypothetical protein
MFLSFHKCFAFFHWSHPGLPLRLSIACSVTSPGLSFIAAGPSKYTPAAPLTKSIVKIVAGPTAARYFMPDRAHSVHAMPSVNRIGSQLKHEAAVSCGVGISFGADGVGA